MKRSSKKTISLCIAGLMFLCALPLAAKTAQKSVNHPARSLTIYAKPSVKAKVLAHIKKNEKVTPFFAKSGWLKVGINKTGQVGWVHTDKLHKHHRSNHFHFTQKEKGPHSTRIFEYSGSKNISPKQAREMIKHMHKRQMAMLREMQKFQHEMMNNALGMEPMMQPLIIFPGEEIKIKSFPRNKHQNELRQAMKSHHHLRS